MQLQYLQGIQRWDERFKKKNLEKSQTDPRFVTFGGVGLFSSEKWLCSRSFLSLPPVLTNCLLSTPRPLPTAFQRFHHSSLATSGLAAFPLDKTYSSDGSI